MAEKKEMKAIQEERKIPVFTVLKNGAILKNIFVLNKPPSPPPPSILEPKLITTARNAGDQENEEILIVGRHPDCNIMLTHPSISRFHLQIHSKPFSQKLSVMDLSSVHGTWISDKRIEPGIRVELKEGDTLMVGGSSRIYRLHWVPLSCAYDLENQLISALYAPIAEEGKQQNESSLSVDNDEQIEEKNSEKPKEVCLDENSFLIENKEIQILDSILEGIVSLFSEENHEVSVKKEITLAPTMPENMDCTFSDEEEESENNDGEQRQDLNLWSRPAAEAVKLLPSVEVVMEIENQQVEEGNRSLQRLVLTEVVSERENSESYLRRMEQKSSLISMHSSFSVEEAYPVDEIIEEETENQNPMSTEQDQRDILRLWSKPPTAESVNSSLPVEEVFLERKIQQLDKENQISMPLLASPLLPERGNVESVTTEAKINVLNLNFACSDEEVHPAGEIPEEIENKNISRKGHEQRENSCLSAPLVAVSVNSTLPVGEVLLDITDKQFNEGNKTPQSRFAASGLSERENLESPAVRSEKKSSLSNIWSRRGKPASALQVRTGRSSRKSIAVSAKNVLQPQKQDIENELVSRALLRSFDEDGDEVFTPNKENITPNTLLLKSMKRKGMLEEIKHSNSKVNLSPIFHSEEDMSASSDKENQTPKFLQKQKSAWPSSGKQGRSNHETMEMKRGADRAPFQALLENSAGKSRSEASFSNAATRSNLTVNCSRTMDNKVTIPPSFNKSVGEEKKSWTIVVDTTTLLNKESMKSLQLLQGLKRTHLIIPRMVIRELDCLKRRGGLFRRTTEASSVLEWIEDCMVKTNRWIHVQSSVEEGGPIAPTPPASPRSPFSSASGGFPSVTTSSVPFSARGSLMDLVSPTAEDHILECALQFKKIKSHEPLVLLSNDVTLKIKSMAEGLICESAEEFRDSLVNPFSERFMWADSSPRGQTWSCVDDVVLREKFYHCPVSKTLKGESVKGLKLILLHNSHYGQITSVS